MVPGSGGDVQMDLHDYLVCLFQYAFLTQAAAEHRRAPRARATAPRLPHTVAQGVIGERSGANSQLGERRA